MAEGRPGAAGRRPAVFLDRDGVINAERDYVHRVEDFVLLPGTIDALRRLADHGWALVVVTNQAGIAKGLYDEADYQRLTTHMCRELADQGVRLTGVYHCPHHPQGTVAAYACDSDCRKPAPGMLIRAARELSLDLPRSVMVGDKPSDTLAGRAADLLATVLVESGHALPANALEFADHRCADLGQAAAWLCDPQRGWADKPDEGSVA